ncbi:hypothetical protein GCM10010345_88660 [Streptomyces canarius]|uniref:Uncharacterized protein n=1 Tax=Streptomyces canarius TaxID=285453 RepID=A0ABQ3DBS8_9ACTN|nr:hypothetical protein GCM10010345_88660 [Streptomyces canarius]
MGGCLAKACTVTVEGLCLRAAAPACRAPLQQASIMYQVGVGTARCSGNRTVPHQRRFAPASDLAGATPTNGVDGGPAAQPMNTRQGPWLPQKPLSIRA